MTVRVTNAMFMHCRDVYSKMEEHSVMEQIGTQNYKVYTGFLSTMIKDELNFPVAYYSHITKELRRMGCIEQFKRGGGPSKSKWVLHKEPNEGDFVFVPSVPVQKAQGIWEQRIRNLEERVAKLESALRIDNES